MLEVEDILTSVRALTYVAPRGAPCIWDETMHVSLLRAKKGSMQKNVATPFDQSVYKPASGRALRDIKKHSDRILQNFDEPSTERLLSSIKTASLARASTGPENQLISMWSAVEVLLSDPPAGTARIVHYSRLLLPCICLRHVRRQIAAVYDEMLVSYRRNFKDIIAQEQMAKSHDQHTNFAAIVCLKENEALQKQLLSLCK